MHAFQHVGVYVCLSVFLCVYVNVYANLYLYMYPYLCVNYIYIYTHTYIYIYMYYVYIHTYIHAAGRCHQCSMEISRSAAGQELECCRWVLARYVFLCRCESC